MLLKEVTRARFGGGFDYYRWVVGDGTDIIATKDHWPRDKTNFSVEDFHGNAGRSELVNSLFYPETKS